MSKTKTTQTSRRDFLKYLSFGALSLMFANLFGVIGMVSTPKPQSTGTKTVGGYGNTGYGA